MHGKFRFGAMAILVIRDLGHDAIINYLVIEAAHNQYH